MSRNARIGTYIFAGIILIGLSFSSRLTAERQLAKINRIAAEENAAAQAAYDNRDQEVESVVTNGATWSDLLQDMLQAQHAMALSCERKVVGSDQRGQLIVAM